MAAPATVAATHSHNFILNLWVTNAYVEQGGVRNIKGPKAKVTASKATTLRSTAACVEKIPGLIDEGEVSLTLVFRKGVLQTLRNTLRVNQNSEIVASDSGSTWIFDGFITEIGLDVPDDDVVTNDVTIEITGPVTYTPGA